MKIDCIGPKDDGNRFYHVKVTIERNNNVDDATVFLQKIDELRQYELNLSIDFICSEKQITMVYQLVDLGHQEGDIFRINGEEIVSNDLVLNINNVDDEITSALYALSLLPTAYNEDTNVIPQSTLTSRNDAEMQDEVAKNPYANMMEIDETTKSTTLEVSRSELEQSVLNSSDKDETTKSTILEVSQSELDEAFKALEDPYQDVVDTAPLSNDNLDEKINSFYQRMDSGIGGDIQRSLDNLGNDTNSDSQTNCNSQTNSNCNSSQNALENEFNVVSASLFY